MLTIIIPIIRLMLLPLISSLYWHTTVACLIILSILILLNIYSPWSLVRASQYIINDTMSSLLSTLSIWITALILLARYKYFNTKNTPKAFSLTCIILLLRLLISFNTSSLIIFYIRFEASLIPTLLLIMVWGYQPERLQASIYLIIYTVTASLPLLVIIIKTINDFKHVNITICEDFLYSSPHEITIFWFLIIIAFLVKLPIFTVHLWLPKAHVEAPVAGSIILAAILLKLGRYGLRRILIIFNYITKLLSSPIISISLIGGILTSLICLRQSDIKSLIAYSSVGHMGLIVAAIITGSKLGLQAALTIILAHGFSSSALFCIANITYSITNTRRLVLTKGLLSLIPVLSLWWFIFCCANMAAPPRINLLSEIFLISTTISYSFICVLPLAIIRFFTVAYSLYLYSSTNHGRRAHFILPRPRIFISDFLLIFLHLLPIISLLIKPELIISWC